MNIRITRYLSFSVACRWRFHALDRAGARIVEKGIRAWLAWGFRWLADAIDGKLSVALDVDSTPMLSPEEKAAAIQRGLVHAKDLFVELVKLKAVDEEMRGRLPELYRDE